MTTDRRTFLKAGGGFAAAWLGGCRLFECGDAYSVSVLGDMHYDVFPKERFHSAAIAKWSVSGAHPRRLQEFQRNAEMWSGISRRILAASARCVRPDAAFALQLGDLVQGDCESDRLHREMLAEATGLLEGAYPGLPVVSLCGNHDVREGDRDQGAAKAYADYMLPWESKQLAAFAPGGIAATTFGFRRGPDLWIVLDFNHAKRDRPVVEKLLADNPDVRYVFVATHGPVMPMDVWHSRWFYFGWGGSDDDRRAMRALFAGRNAIVLAGHEHTLSLKDWFGDGGRITEIVLNTCAGVTGGGVHPAQPRVLSENPAEYGDWAAAMKPETGMKALYDEYRPGLRRRFASRAVGHHVLRVSDAAVELDYYGHDALAPTMTFTLRG